MKNDQKVTERLERLVKFLEARLRYLKNEQEAQGQNSYTEGCIDELVATLYDIKRFYRS